MTDLEFEHLHRPDGWSSPGRLTISEDGLVATIHDSEPPGWSPAERITGFAVPGMPNLHSHAFQRALAGRTEHRSGRDDRIDNLWTWRAEMYRFVGRLGPDDLEAIAALAYLELVMGGFTAVGEFHYLHRDPAGVRYADPAEMTWALVSAARDVGLPITVLPVLYRHAGPGKPAAPEQSRFVLEVDEVVEIATRVRAGNPGQAWSGIAPHSLRAVDPDELRELVVAWGAAGGGPIHVHVAERPEEVADVRAAHGVPPLRLLADTIGIDAGWTLVHATHGEPDEHGAVARSGATVALCPMTEATVADGLFPLVRYAGAGGRWGIGTDSHYTTDVSVELRMLELGQRLLEGRRNPLVTESAGPVAHAGRVLFDAALSAGEASLGQPVGAIKPGVRADLVVLDPTATVLAGHGPTTALDAWILSGGGASPVRDVMIAGRWVVRDGHHGSEDGIIERYRRTLRRLAET
ncbi:MAG TPA: formimidoylglutamate deiminase [Candidatus Limnocylindrales bacterium]|nr:formimidoylglutamate deiminase [Candidatus Limnocylindrales bacterium]